MASAPRRAQRRPSCAANRRNSPCWVAKSKNSGKRSRASRAIRQHNRPCAREHVPRRPTGARMKPFEGALHYLAVFHRHLGYRMHIVFVLALLAAATEGFGITLLLPLLSVVATDIGGLNGTPHAVTWLLEALGVAGSLPGILLLIGVAFLVKGVIAFAYGGYGGRLNAQ